VACRRKPWVHVVTCVPQASKVVTDYLPQGGFDRVSGELGFIWVGLRLHLRASATSGPCQRSSPRRFMTMICGVFGKCRVTQFEGRVHQR